MKHGSPETRCPFHREAPSPSKTRGPFHLEAPSLQKQGTHFTMTHPSPSETRCPFHRDATFFFRNKVPISPWRSSLLLKHLKEFMLIILCLTYFQNRFCFLFRLCYNHDNHWLIPVEGYIGQYCSPKWALSNHCCDPLSLHTIHIAVNP